MQKAEVYGDALARGNGAVSGEGTEVRVGEGLGGGSVSLAAGGLLRMRQELELTVALLERTPGALEALLRGLPEVWTGRDEGAGTWTVFGVVGHLIHGERTDWMPRVRMILEVGESRAFAPFDRLAQERESAGKSLDELLGEFAAARRANLEELRGLGLRQEDMQRRGRHPALGAVTLGELLATWAAHDMTHLHQISRVMAYQYREEVGPWREYLGVLRCAGGKA